ncbi:MAG: hypothetical protein K8L99_23315, partial [Anaerolineae bacterium]|nr:hypothetical protein [Anaerolineae bacterium]
MSFGGSAQAQTGIYRETYTNGDWYLTVELLDDDLAHFQLSSSANVEITTTPMVAKTDYSGPSEVVVFADNSLETADMHLEIDEATLCITAV